MYTKTTIPIADANYSKSAVLYCDASATQKACLLYFHGGGLLYGSKEDLPEWHLRAFTGAGYPILAFDYPLAPAAKLPEIEDDLIASVHYYEDHISDLFPENPTLPYVLFGRSAGAYLSLLTASRQVTHPSAVISYYGYGMLTDGWINVPSQYYRSLPPVPSSCLDSLPEDVQAYGPLETHYSAYIYARQNGMWKNLIYEGREKFFWLDYSLRLVNTLPCPIFAVHSIKDEDVPYAEFTELCSRYRPVRFIASGDCHDFDRTDNELTARLLRETTAFLDRFFPDKKTV